VSDSLNWSARPAIPLLATADVHVWRAFLNSDRALPESLKAMLSGDELARASRFVFPVDRDHFISSRGILRCILGEYLRRPARAIEFTYDPTGKPRLRRSDADVPIRFNLSHSHGLTMYAFSLNREVGIDVEAVRQEVTVEELAERFFSPRELAEFRCLTPGQRNERFFLYWTRKEAYAKALGSGLWTALNSLDVSPTTERPDELTTRDSTSWMVRSFRPADGYVSALVAEGTDLRLHFWNWDSYQ
jgi:4'-phosphopantetheinyl transferase